MKIQDIKKILIIQIKPYGDVLLTTSYFQALAKQFPNAKIDFLVRKPYHKVLFNNPYLNDTLLVEKVKGFKYFLDRIRVIKEVRNNKYDLIIDQQNGTGSGQITLFSGAKYRLGYANGKWRIAHNLHAGRGPQRYSASRKFDILGPLGIKEQDYNLYYYIKDESRQKISDWFKEHNLIKEKTICFSPGSPVQRKKWSKESYAGLADKIIESTDYKVTFLWAPNELDDVKDIMAMMKHNALLALPTDFNECAAFLENVSLLICNDGGINHLAVSTKTNTLAMFGTTSPEVWSPASAFTTHHHLYNPNHNSFEDSSFGIPISKAFAKVQDILKIR
jgi:ADP-heptose:LPS heptosyltransferase